MGLDVEAEKRSRGEYVEVFGLQSQTGRRLNRKRGIVIKANDDTGRIEVCLGPEGKITSLKPENLRLVPEATAEEVQDAKDEAGPALRAAQGIGASPEHDIISTATPAPPQRERSRSWSPPPETVRAASVAGQQAASAAVGRGLSSAQAEAFGSAAAEQFLARSKQAAHVQKRQGGQCASTNKSVGATSLERKTPNSLEQLKVGDSVQVIGLKGADQELCGQRCVIDRIVVLNATSRKYVVSTNRFIIDAQGDPAEAKVVLTIAAKNIRLPGDDSAFIDSSGESSSSKRPKKKRAAKRSRSRRRSRRARSRSDSTSFRSTRHVQAADRGRGSTSAVLSKADRLQKFGFQAPRQQPSLGSGAKAWAGQRI